MRSEPLLNPLLPHSLHKTQHEFRVALSDSFNTPDALARLVDLVSRTNIYISRGRKEVNIGVIKNVAVWVTKMLRMFGLADGADNGGIGWGRASANGETESFDVSYRALGAQPFSSVSN